MTGPSFRWLGHCPGGFSLLEILLVTALTAVLVSLAVPTYQSFAVRTYRAEAITVLMRAAACQEKQRIVSGAYQPDVCQQPQTERYQYTTVTDNERASSGFRITANPIGRQALDNCGAISVDHNGFRSVENQAADVTRCWSGR